MTNAATLLTQLENGSLPPEKFNHFGHVRAAWLALEEEGEFAAALTRYSHALKAYARTQGVPGKYNETITVFFMALIHRHRCESGPLDWQAFQTAWPTLFEAPGQLLERHYSQARLNSALARSCFLLPDNPEAAQPREIDTPDVIQGSNPGPFASGGE